jgi:hypothetical protein
VLSEVWTRTEEASPQVTDENPTRPPEVFGRGRDIDLQSVLGPLAP